MADASGALCIELWERLEGDVRTRLAGPATIPLLRLPTVSTRIAMKRRGCHHGVLHLYAHPSDPAGLAKKVFFVRHGESKWNAAKKKHNVFKMVKE